MKKIEFRDLSWPLKAGVVGGLIYLFTVTLMLFLGFIGGVLA